MGGSDGFSRLTPLQNGLLGVSAGTIEIFALQPMLFCKNATQQNLPLSMNPKVLYRGVVMSATNMAIITGTQFPLTGDVLRIGAISKFMSGGSNQPLSDGQTIAAAFLGGAISGIICCPMELVVIQQQRFGLSVLQTPQRIISEFGISTMMRGVSPTIGREALFTMGYLGLGPVLAGRITQATGVEGFGAKFGGSVCAGVVAATLSHPLDTIKTCVQGDVQRVTYGSLSETVRTLHASGGAKRFFSGWSWRTSRMILAVFIMGQCKERLAPLFFPDVFAY